MCLEKLKALREQVTVCEPLLNLMSEAIEKRFGHLFDDMECLICPPPLILNSNSSDWDMVALGATLQS